MEIPDLDCRIDAYCSINPSEDPKKVEQSISNIFPDMNIKLDKDSLTATSSNLESLSRIYETIQARKTQKVYRRQLNNNLMDDSTWFYLNKQAAFANTITLCSEAEESPLGPIKVILNSKNIERIIEWLVSYS
jgi:predicted RNA binding protein with dsRBD fold (UPF0201 family)